jgi:hypothetical protein
MDDVGKFISHSCSPNLFAEIVLWDHGDKIVPRVMVFFFLLWRPFHKLTCKYVEYTFWARGEWQDSV